jgi:hypothetical protein
MAKGSWRFARCILLGWFGISALVVAGCGVDGIVRVRP